MSEACISLRSVLAEQTERTRGSSPTRIKQLIHDSDSKIASLQTQITALESQIAALAELRDCEHATGAALRFLVAPVRTLPVELLAEMFILTIGQSSHIQDAYRVSHVCCDWRQIAHGTPRLWAGPIKVDFQPFGSVETYVDGLQAWFARSSPLSVSISFTGLRAGMWFADINPRITEEVLRISLRWRSLRMLQRAPGSLVKRLAEGRLDSLEELELQKVAPDDPDFDPTTILSFTTAPRLRKLTIQSDCQIPMPWVQLTDVTLTQGHSPDIARGYRAQCTNLVCASISTNGWSVFPPLRPDIITLNHLRRLSLECFGMEEHIMPFLDRLSAPALDDLRLDFESEPIMQWAVHMFTDFQLRSPNITKLEINGCGLNLPSSALRTVLLHAPILTHLSLNDCSDCIDDNLLRALCYTDGVPPLVPRLHTLTLTEMTGVELSEDLLACTIVCRWTGAELASPPVARWRQIKLDGESTHSAFRLSQHFRDVMDDLRKTGLAVEFV